MQPALPAGNRFNTQPPEGGCFQTAAGLPLLVVSTHSRLKAAAIFWTICNSQIICFNTQPPEGGCFSSPHSRNLTSSFNTQPPEGGCRPPHHCLRYQ